MSSHRVTSEVERMADADPGAVLRRSKTIAVVGLSSNSARPSHGVARYLQGQGYRIIPVNPHASEVLGERAYPSVGAIPEPVDLVDVFRASDAAPEVARDAVRAGAKALWLQLGVRSDEARRIARAGGLDYVEDQCTKIVHAMTA